MFGSRRLRGSTAVNSKENPAPLSAARSGKAGLLGANDGAAGGVAGKPAMAGAQAPGVLTPRAKAFGGKPHKAPTGLREVLQTPSARTPAPKAAGQAPRTVKRRPGLFSPAPQRTANTVATQEPSLLLEPEYAPPKPAAPGLDAASEFGFDLDIGLVPLTQLAMAGLRQAALPAPDLSLEELAEVAATPSHLPGPQPASAFDALDIPLLACTPTPLLARALCPTRIPRLKRARQQPEPRPAKRAAH
ncbi:hypothetical protein H4R19_001481 [Coemansia spiralis]|nr:hypothetical protein H4R19_001481 [Coemansia spiralis]